LGPLWRTIRIRAGERVDGGMNPRELVGPGALEALGDRLDELHAATDVPVTARRPWLDVWIRSYREFEPWAVIVEGSDGRLEAAALLARRRHGPLTEIVALGDGPSDYVRLPARNEVAASALARSLVDRLARLQGAWRMTVNFLPEGDDVATRLTALISSARWQPGDKAPRLRFKADRRLRAHLSRSVLQRERTAWNRFRRVGLEAALERLEGPEHVRQVIDQLESVRRRRDARVGRRTLIDSRAGRSFWRSVLVEHARQGSVQVFGLRVGGELAAYSVCFSDGESLRFWDGRVDPDWEQFSAGFLVNLASLRWALGNGRFSEYDWMRGVEGYKLQMSTDVVSTRNLLAYSSPGVGRLLGAPVVLKTRLRPLAERYPALLSMWNTVKELPAYHGSVRRSGAAPGLIAPRVLVTDAGDAQARSALAAVRALAAAGYTPAVARSGPYSLAAASRFCRRIVDVPSADDPGFRAALDAELQSGSYLAILPSSDAALLGVEARVEDLVNKERIAERARGAGVPTPPTEVFHSAEEALDRRRDIQFPVVVKPATRRSAIPAPAYLARAPQDLSLAREWGGPLLIQAYLREEIHAVCGVVWQGRLRASVHQRYLRTWPRDCGTSSAAVTIEPDIDLEERLLAILAGYDGIFQAQLAGPYLLDLNPRVYGSLPLAVAAGANLVGAYCGLLRGKEPPPLRARPGVFYRWLEGDVRSLWTAVRGGEMPAFSALRELRPRRSAHSTESVRDPRPALVRALYAVRKGGRSRRS
jgi:CelD/BcsL family acetyltransferase involved in cellulose biosynthesis